MSMKNETLSATLSATATPPNVELDPIQRQLQMLLLKRLQKEDEEEEAKKESARRLQLEGAKAMVNRAKADEDAQKYCSHRKENGQSAIVGQRDHQHHTHYLCLHCNKHWLDRELPDDLMPKGEHIGGPNV